MITGFSNDELVEIRKILRSPHWIASTAMVMDMDHNAMGDLALMSGQVNFDASADVTRTAEIVVSDPKSTLSLVPNSPKQGSAHMKRMIRIVYAIAPADKSKWYYIPLITGPITGIQRGDYTVTIQIAGKDSLGFASVWKPISRRKGFRLTDLIHDILVDILGESRLQIVGKKKTLSKEVSINRKSVPWKVIKRFAKALGMHAYYDGRGIFRLRAYGNQPVFKFTEATIKTIPNFSYDPSTIKNAVYVEGGKPKGSKKKVTGKWVAPKSHPLSPQELGRKNAAGEQVGRYYVEEIQDGSLKTKRGCKQLARKTGERRLLESLNVEMDTLPIPLFEEHDAYKIEMESVVLTARMMQWSIGLTHDASMSVGAIKKLSFSKKRKKWSSIRFRKLARP